MISGIALAVSILASVAVVGLFIGNVKFRGAGLGIGGVLLGGITVDRFVSQARITLGNDVLHVIQEFGLTLFVCIIGVQVGLGFFASLYVSGLRLNLLAVLVVIIDDLAITILHKLFGIPLPVVLGTFSGVVTNTPALGAGQQVLRDLGTPMAMIDQIGMSHVVVCPFGICGILFTMWMLWVIFRINVETEAQQYESVRVNGDVLIRMISIRIEDPSLHNLVVKDVLILNGDKIICSRLEQEETLRAPPPETVTQLGDSLHLVGQPADLHNAQLVIGQEVDTSLPTKGTDSRIARVVIANESMLGKHVHDLHFKERYDVVTSCLNRAGVELVASSDISLQFGGIPNLVGRPSAIDVVANMPGGTQQKLQQVQVPPVFIGIGFSVLLGSIPVFVPGFPAAPKLRLADDPLIMALTLRRIGSIGKLYWFILLSANLVLHELGTILFLSVVGLESDDDFIRALMDGEGLGWIGYGTLIAVVPLITAGILMRVLTKMNYLAMRRAPASSVTDFPALASANNPHLTSDVATLSYAIVYPLVVFLHIIAPQSLAILFWSID